MRYVKVGKVPDKVCKSESLQAALRGADKIEDYTDEEEWQHIALADVIPASFHGHEEVGRAGNNRNEHPRAENNGHGLQPPG